MSRAPWPAAAAGRSLVFRSFFRPFHSFHLSFVETSPTVGRLRFSFVFVDPLSFACLCVYRLDSLCGCRFVLLAPPPRRRPARSSPPAPHDSCSKRNRHYGGYALNMKSELI